MTVTSTNAIITTLFAANTLEVADNNAKLSVISNSSYLNISKQDSTEIVVNASTPATINVTSPISTISVESNFSVGAVEALIKDIVPPDILSAPTSAIVAKVEMLLVQYDEDKELHYVTTSSLVQGDLVSLLILLDGESVEVFGNYNLIGNRVEFQLDFSAAGLTARVTYLKK